MYFILIKLEKLRELSGNQLHADFIFWSWEIGPKPSNWKWKLDIFSFTCVLMLLYFYALRLIRSLLGVNYYFSYSWGVLVTHAFVFVLSCTFRLTCSCYLPDRKELQEGWEKEISTQIRLSNQALFLQHDDITDTSTAELKFAEECQEIQ